jgi:NAD(P)H dehydrogenase (quinone)
MPKLLVLFHSRTGRTAALADAIAEGAKSVRFAEVDVRRIEEPAAPEGAAGDPAAVASAEGSRGKHRVLADPAALAGYDGIILGSPARHGVAAAEVTRLLDRLRALGGAGALVDKVGSAFVPSEPAGGHETALWSMLTPLARLGAILVPPFQADDAGAEDETAAARAQGRRDIPLSPSPAGASRRPSSSGVHVVDVDERLPAADDLDEGGVDAGVEEGADVVAEVGDRLLLPHRGSR